MYRKILVPLDGSAHSRLTLDHAVALAAQQPEPCELIVLHVGSYAVFADMAMVPDLTRWLEDEGRAILDGAEAAFGGTSVNHRGQYVIGDPAEQICLRAEAEGCDLVVIGNRGRGVFSELLLGSVSLKVIQHASCPVLVVRQPSEAR